MNSKLLKGGLVLLSVSVASEVLWQLYRYLKKNQNDHDHEAAVAVASSSSSQNSKSTSDLWNTVLFFPDKKNTGQESVPFQLYGYLEAAKRSIKICVFRAALPAFEHIILKKWTDGLTIEVITDHGSMMTHTNVNCLAFQNAGIPLRNNTGHSMHNNFILIDDDALLTGSLNLTAEGLLVNKGDLVVTTEAGIVGTYKDQFHLLWAEGKDSDLQ